MSNQELYFDKIIKHLDRKKVKPTYGSDKQSVKVSYYFDDKLNTEQNYIMMHIDYNYYNMTVTYFPEKRNPYKVYIEHQCVLGRSRQELGIHYWEDTWYRQEDVIEYIRYKLR